MLLRDFFLIFLTYFHVRAFFLLQDTILEVFSDPLDFLAEVGQAIVL